MAAKEPFQKTVGYINLSQDGALPVFQSIPVPSHIIGGEKITRFDASELSLGTPVTELVSPGMFVRERRAGNPFIPEGTTRVRLRKNETGYVDNFQVIISPVTGDPLTNDVFLKLHDDEKPTQAPDTIRTLIGHTSVVLFSSGGLSLNINDSAAAVIDADDSLMINRRYKKQEGEWKSPHEYYVNDDGTVLECSYGAFWLNEFIGDITVSGEEVGYTVKRNFLLVSGFVLATPYVSEITEMVNRYVQEGNVNDEVYRELVAPFLRVVPLDEDIPGGDTTAEENPTDTK